MGRDLWEYLGTPRLEFQFTRPAWGATPGPPRIVNPHVFQFTRPAWGATIVRGQKGNKNEVSIHAPRVGRDHLSPASHDVREFQFTRPAWGATVRHASASKPNIVSIHAPRVGRDSPIPSTAPYHCVSIHAPRVGRDAAPSYIIVSPHVFQFTRPAWGATL